MKNLTGYKALESKMDEIEAAAAKADTELKTEQRELEAQYT